MIQGARLLNHFQEPVQRVVANRLHIMTSLLPYVRLIMAMVVMKSYTRVTRCLVPRQSRLLRILNLTGGMPFSISLEQSRHTVVCNPYPHHRMSYSLLDFCRLFLRLVFLIVSFFQSLKLRFLDLFFLQPLLVTKSHQTKNGVTLNFIFSLGRLGYNTIHSISTNQVSSLTFRGSQTRLCPIFSPSILKFSSQFKKQMRQLLI